MKGDHDVEDLIATYGVEPPEDPSTPFIVAQEVALQDDGTHHISLVISSMAILDTILHDDKEKILQLDYTHGLSVDDLLVEPQTRPTSTVLLVEPQTRPTSTVQSQSASRLRKTPSLRQKY